MARFELIYKCAGRARVVHHHRKITHRVITNYNYYKLLNYHTHTLCGGERMATELLAERNVLFKPYDRRCEWLVWQAEQASARHIIYTQTHTYIKVLIKVDGFYTCVRTLKIKKKRAYVTRTQLISPIYNIYTSMVVVGEFMRWW